MTEEAKPATRTLSASWSSYGEAASRRIAHRPHGTRLRAPRLGANLQIVQNGPPGTFVRFADGRRVPLPTDQIVSSDDGAGAARVGFGGMRFDGVEGGLLTFRRFRDLVAEHELSPERGRRMTLEPEMVAAVFIEGRLVWGRPTG